MVPGRGLHIALKVLGTRSRLLVDGLPDMLEAPAQQLSNMSVIQRIEHQVRFPPGTQNSELTQDTKML